VRTIKFRAWDKHDKVMYQVYRLSGLDAKNFNPLVYVNREKAEISLDGYELMQFTGLKDKNGKEIYEGDIVRFRGHSWDIDGNHYHPIKTEKIVFEGGAFDCNYRYEEDCYDVGWEEVEVIGNIYENKELLMEGN